MMASLTLLMFSSLFKSLKEAIGILSLLALTLISNTSSISWGQTMMIDGYKALLMVLSIWIIFFMLLSWKSVSINKISMLFAFAFMLSNLFTVFMLEDFLMFYISFEFVVVPTFLLILGWGPSAERVQAGLFMFIYTLISSLPVLVFLVKLYSMDRQGLLFYPSSFLPDSKSLSIWWLVIMLVFMVSLPIFMLHLWLPKAHVEAPIMGSMILAGVLLKLGGYGAYKTFSICKGSLGINFSKSLIALSIMGGVYTAIICLCQEDIKSLVAYSSIVHMGPVLAGILTMYWMGWLGSFLIMLSHGLCSSAMFYILTLIYESMGSRSISLMKGVIFSIPPISFLWFTLSALNMSVPPSMNFYSEMISMMALLGIGGEVIVIMGLMFLMVGIYSVFFYVTVNHSVKKMIYFPNHLAEAKEYMAISGHTMPLILAAGYMSWML